eukprot:scaffold73583_cov35-Tisochrysis_lutea.AAC.3
MQVDDRGAAGGTTGMDGDVDGWLVTAGRGLVMGDGTDGEWLGGNEGGSGGAGGGHGEGGGGEGGGLGGGGGEGCGEGGGELGGEPGGGRGDGGGCTVAQGEGGGSTKVSRGGTGKPYIALLEAEVPSGTRRYACSSSARSKSISVALLGALLVDARASMHAVLSKGWVLEWLSWPWLGSNV